MSIKVYDSTYKDQKAVALESKTLKVKFLPELGGKMASLVYKESSREFLVQTENPQYKILQYDGDYVAAECSGFDDMFPTIDSFYYHDYPWQGIRVPDHGEVCGLKWDYSIQQDCLYMCVFGVRFPYKFEKWVSFKSDNQLDINYRVTNLSNYDMDFIWAAHVMLCSEEGGQILVPYKEGQAVSCVFSTDKGFGTYGEEMLWPEARRKDGAVQKIDITSVKGENGNNYKFYFKDKMPEGWCGYRYRSDNTTLIMSFPEDKVPYLGIWVNEGSFHGFNNLALEPCTGSFDRPDLAKMHSQYSVLNAKGEYRWHLTFCIKQGE
ncbi:MAG: DUF5107 domain-containing protein [Acetivibrionales bacterium]|jgi:galactose mutarotase-like enzyme